MSITVLCMILAVLPFDKYNFLQRWKEMERQKAAIEKSLKKQITKYVRPYIFKIVFQTSLLHTL